MTEILGFKLYTTILMLLHFLMVLSVKMNAKEDDEVHGVIVTVVIVIFFAFIPLYYKGLFL